jgi:hypothetical protein
MKTGSREGETVEVRGAYHAELAPIAKLENGVGAPDGALDRAIVSWPLLSTAWDRVADSYIVVGAVAAVHFD